MIDFDIEFDTDDHKARWPHEMSKEELLAKQEDAARRLKEVTVLLNNAMQNCEQLGLSIRAELEPYYQVGGVAQRQRLETSAFRRMP
jgi:hypothetical protein